MLRGDSGHAWRGRVYRKAARAHHTWSQAATLARFHVELLHVPPAFLYPLGMFSGVRSEISERVQSSRFLLLKFKVEIQPFSVEEQPPPGRASEMAALDLQPGEAVSKRSVCCFLLQSSLCCPPLCFCSFCFPGFLDAT